MVLNRYFLPLFIFFIHWNLLLIFLFRVNCQKACKKCADIRPCPRCVKYGLENGCIDSARKERKKGVKRGPYRRKMSLGIF